MSAEKTQTKELYDAFRELHKKLPYATLTIALFEAQIRRIIDPECCAEEEAQEVHLELLPIYEAYRRAPLVDATDALRLTFLEVQSRHGYALTWPG